VCLIVPLPGLPSRQLTVFEAEAHVEPGAIGAVVVEVPLFAGALPDGGNPAAVAATSAAVALAHIPAGALRGLAQACRDAFPSTKAIDSSGVRCLERPVMCWRCSIINCRLKKGVGV
jgi:hypothetical protein